MNPLDEIGRGCFCLQSRMTARAVTRAFDAALKPLGLRTTQFSLLVAAAHGGATSLTQLAEALALERTTLLRNVELLARAGLLARSAGGRAETLHLTDAGRALLDRAIPLWRQIQAQIAARLPTGDGEAVREGLRALRRAVRPAQRVRAGSSAG